MRALHLTYRFGREALGGAEWYMYMLSRALVGLGVDVEIWTTRTSALSPLAHFGVRWDNAVEVTHETVDGIDVRRYTTFNFPRWLVLLFGRILMARWREEEWRLPEDVERWAVPSLLGSGWHALETHGAVRMRWTGKRASLVLRDQKISEIRFEAMCPRRIAGRVEANGRVLGAFQTTEDWQSHRIAGDGSSGATYEIVLERTWRPAADPRRLGIAVRRIGYTADGVDKSVDLAADYWAALTQDSSALVSELIARASRRPRIFDWLFFLLRAPLAPAMLLDLERKIRRYDVILAQMAPYSTLNYAVCAGRRHGVPVVLLPHFHAEGDFYHWRHYYDALRGADRVLISGDVSKKIFFDRLGARAEVVGGGVDPTEFQQDAAAAGERFRRRFGLGNIPLILFVGRKSPPKRYEMLVNAVDFLSGHLECRLVMIGPDEDQRAIPSKSVVYLGRQDRRVVVDAYHACDVFAMMSDSESFGIAFLEAWMAKKPVIGNRRCIAVAELIEDGVNGFLCGDELDCAEKIAVLLLDRALARRLGENGHRRVFQSYSWDALGKEVKRIYERLAGGASPPGGVSDPIVPC